MAIFHVPNFLLCTMGYRAKNKPVPCSHKASNLVENIYANRYDVQQMHKMSVIKKGEKELREKTTSA